MKFISRRSSQWLASFAALLGLTACASNSLLSEVASAVFRENFSDDARQAPAVKLNPSYQYLLATLDGAKPALLVLGYVDTHPQGNIEVWYSGQGEVIRLQNGRLVGSTGLAVQWRRVVYPTAPPAWQSVPASGVQFARIRDEHPGYRLGFMDQVFLTPLQISPHNLPSDVQKTAVWYQERYAEASGESIPAAWFALGTHDGQTTIVYSRQCLSPSLCLTLQRWPLKKDSL